MELDFEIANNAEVRKKILDLTYQIYAFVFLTPKISRMSGIDFPTPRPEYMKGVFELFLMPLVVLSLAKDEEYTSSKEIFEAVVKNFEDIKKLIVEIIETRNRHFIN